MFLVILSIDNIIYNFIHNIAITLCQVDIQKENSIYAAIEHMKPLVEIERRLMNIIPVDLLDRWINERSDLSAFAVSVREFGKFELEYDEDVERYILYLNDEIYKGYPQV